MQGLSCVTISARDFEQAPEGRIQSSTEGVRFIPLETRKECLINIVAKVKGTKDGFYILPEGGSQPIYVFDLRGKFLRTIGHAGKGPSEYVHLADFCVENKTGDILLLCKATRRLIRFTSDGSYLSDLRLQAPGESFGPRHLGITDDSFYVIESIGQNNLLIFNSSGQLIQKRFPITRSFVLRQFPLGDHGGTVVYQTMFNDTLYSVKSGKIEPLVCIDFGDIAATEEGIEKYGIPDRLYPEIKSFPDRFVERLDLFEVNTIHIVTMQWNREAYFGLLSKSGKKFNLIHCSKKGTLGSSIPWPEGTGVDNHLISFLYPAYMAEEYNSLVLNPPKKVSFETSVTQKLNPEDNPVLIVYGLK